MYTIQRHRTLVEVESHHHAVLLVAVEQHLQVGSHRHQFLKIQTVVYHGRGAEETQQAVECGVVTEAQRHARLARCQDAVSTKYDVAPQIGGTLCRDTVIGRIHPILIAHLTARSLIAIAHLVGSEEVVERDSRQVNILQVGSHGIEFREETCRVGDGLWVAEE